jgi:acyl carrier protein
MTSQGDGTAVSEVATVVSEAFARIVGEPPARGPETTPADAGSWDSLAHVQLVFEIEQALGIRMPENTLISRTTVGALVEAAEAVVRAS